MDKFLTKTKRSREDSPSAAPSTSVGDKLAKPSVAPEVVALLADLRDEAWRAALQQESEKSYFADLARAVAADRKKKTVFPPAAEVFTAFNLTPLPAVRIVILGQDPCKPPHPAPTHHMRAC